MPLFSDATHFDICARNLLRGGVHYKDIGDGNLPGMVWVHVAVRSAFGWSPAALRGVDLVVVIGIVWLLVGCLGSMGLSPHGCIWTADVLLLFYFSTTEWTHCQRDVWMLLPALVGLSLRQRQVAAIFGGCAGRSCVLRSTCEGVCWGVAFWIKPFVGLPALFCWVFSSICFWRLGKQRRVRLLFLDTGGLLAGGLLVGGLGTWWLLYTGSWPYMWKIIIGGHPEYFAGSTQIPLQVRFARVFLPHWPWGLVHLAALPLAFGEAARLLGRDSVSRSDSEQLRHRALLSVFYFGWLVQAVFLQYPHDYVLAPLVFLGLTLVAGCGCAFLSLWFRLVAVCGYIAFALLYHPVIWLERLELWGRCWREGNTPELRDRLTLTHMSNSTSWVQLREVAEYLRVQQLHDGELNCFTSSTIPLYNDFDVKPPSMTLHFEIVFSNYPSYVEELRGQLNVSPQRFVVTDLRYPSVILNKQFDNTGDSALALPAGFPHDWAVLFPWNQPIVFRTDRYLVHRVTGPVDKLLPPRRKG